MNLKGSCHALALIFLLVCSQTLSAQGIREYMDLQIHTTMHVPYGFFSDGLLDFPEGNPPKLSYKHLLTNVNYANYLRQNPGARILVNGALNQEWVRRKKKARRTILEQINYVNDFVAKNPDDFAVAKSPQEVRDLVANTRKTIFIHSIEGGKRLLNSQADADFWAAQGVAFVTLVHLIDDENGAAATAPGFITHFINMKGGFRREKKRHLTEHGRQAILWLANAGIMTDITHMSDLTRKDALAFMATHKLPPLSTHDGFKPIQNSPRGIAEEDILKIYAEGGLVSLPISGESLKPHKPFPAFQQALDSLDNHCECSIDSYKFTYLALQTFIQGNAGRLLQDSTLNWADLSEAQKVDFSIGFQTDFNGWLNHHRPKYGKDGCFPLEAGKTYPAIELEGMPHPGFMQAHWEWLEKEGVELSPIKRSSEKFLQMWQYFLDHRNTY